MPFSVNLFVTDESASKRYGVDSQYILLVAGEYAVRQYGVDSRYIPQCEWNAILSI